MFCPEIAVLQSALFLVEREVGQDALCVLNRQQAVSYVRIIQTAVKEITEGLQTENEEEEKVLWGCKLHNLLLYKLLASQYRDPEKPQHDTGDEPLVVDKLDVLSGIIPSFSHTLYFEAVKACDWFELLKEALWNIHEDMSTKILYDGTKYLTAPEGNTDFVLDRKELMLATSILDYIISYLLTSGSGPISGSGFKSISGLGSTSGSGSKSKSGTECGSGSISEVDSTSGSKLPSGSRSPSGSGPISGSGSKSGSGSTSGTGAIPSHPSAPGDKFTTYAVALRAFFMYLDKVLSFCPRKGQNQLLESITSLKSVWTSCFTQVAVLVSVMCSDCNTDSSHVRKWFRRSVKAITTQKVSRKSLKLTESYRKFLKQETEYGAVLDISTPLLKEFQNIISIKLLMSLLKKLIILTKKDLNKILHTKTYSERFQNIAFVRLGQAVFCTEDKTFARTMKVLSECELECDLQNLLTYLYQVLMIQKANVDNNSDYETTADMDVILENIREIYPTVSESEDHSFLSLPVLLWRLDTRQPGFEDDLSVLIGTKDMGIWQSDMVLDALGRNIELLTEDVQLKLYDLLVELGKIQGVSKFQALKKMILKGFCQLSASVRNEHIEYVHKKYRCWPEVDALGDPKSDNVHCPSVSVEYAQKVNTAMNRLTSGPSLKVELEIQQLALQNATFIVQKLVERASSNKEQSEIIHQLLMGISRVCKVRLPGSEVTLLHHILDDYLTRSQLSQKEQRNFVHFIKLLVQNSGNNSQQSVLDGSSLIDPLEFLPMTVLPYITLAHLHNPEHPISVSFALEVAITICEVLLKHGNSLDVDQPMSDSVSKLPWHLDLDMCPSLLCIGQLLNHFILPHYEEEKCPSKILKEKLIHFLRILQDVNKTSPIFQGFDWLRESITDFDWLTQLAIYDTCLPTAEVNKIYEDVAKSVLSCQEGTEAVVMNVLRCASLNDSMLEVISNAVKTTGLCVQYNPLLVILLQILPNLVPDEWRRCSILIKQLIATGQLVVPYRSPVSGYLPFVNLQELQNELCISQVLHDTMILLSRCIMGNTASVVSHCVNAYILTVRTTVLPVTKSLPPESCLLLLVHVFHHVVSATCWSAEELHEPASVLMLDLVCRVEDLRFPLKRNKEHFYTVQLRTLTDTTQSVVSEETQKMLMKKLSSLH